jgi:hypothetical protein
MGGIMKDFYESHLFWGSRAPLSALTGSGMLIIASGRLAFALTGLGALIWVNCLSTLAVFYARPVFPQKGKDLVLVFLSSFIASVYLLFLWLLNPVLGMEVFMVALLAPFIYIGSGLPDRVDKEDPWEAVFTAFQEAAVLGGVTVAFALIREPLGFLSLSLPGGAQGIFPIFSFEEGKFFPLQIISSSAGALLILGYGVGIFRHFRNRFHSGDNS